MKGFKDLLALKLLLNIKIFLENCAKGPKEAEPVNELVSGPETAVKIDALKTNDEGRLVDRRSTSERTVKRGTISKKHSAADEDEKKELVAGQNDSDTVDKKEKMTVNLHDKREKPTKKEEGCKYKAVTTRDQMLVINIRKALIEMQVNIFCNAV